MGPPPPAQTAVPCVPWPRGAGQQPTGVWAVGPPHPGRGQATAARPHPGTPSAAGAPGSGGRPRCAPQNAPSPRYSAQPSHRSRRHAPPQLHTRRSACQAATQNVPPHATHCITAAAQGRHRLHPLRPPRSSRAASSAVPKNSMLPPRMRDHVPQARRVSWNTDDRRQVRQNATSTTPCHQPQSVRRRRVPPSLGPHSPRSPSPKTRPRPPRLALRVARKAWASSRAPPHRKYA